MSFENTAVPGLLGPSDRQSCSVLQKKVVHTVVVCRTELNTLTYFRQFLRVEQTGSRRCSGEMRQ